MTAGAVAVLIIVVGPAALSALAHRASLGAPPAWAAGTLAVALVGTAASGLVALGTLAWPLFARADVVAAVGGWSIGRAVDLAPVPPVVSSVATIALFAATGCGVRVVVREALVVASLGPDAVPFLVVDDDQPFACAIYGWRRRPNQVVMSTGLIARLGAEERAAAIAHERAHLRNHHAALALCGSVASAVNPLLRRAHRTLLAQLERWADEEAARATDRRATARLLLHVTMACRSDREVEPNRGGCRVAAPHLVVPERLRSLITPRQERPHRAVVVYTTITSVTVALAAVALAQAESILDLLRQSP